MTITADIRDSQDTRFGTGMVIARRERNGYDDSDFLALVATPTAEGGYTFGWVETSSTRYPGGFIAIVDATEEVLAAYRAHREEVLADLTAEREARQDRAVQVGKTVTVVKGRKIPVGTTATVTWRGVDQYRSNRFITAYRVGLLVGGERVYVAEGNVRVTGFEAEDLPDLDTTVDCLIAGAWPRA